MLEETIRVSQYPDSLFFYRRAELVSVLQTNVILNWFQNPKRKVTNGTEKGQK